MKPSVPGLLFVGSVFITYSISFLVIGLFSWSISSWFRFGKLYQSLESCPVLLGCQICWHTIAHSILLCFFVFLQYTLRFLLFHFLFWVLYLLFLVSLATSLSILSTLSKNQHLVLLTFFYCFLNFYFMDQIFSDLYDFLPFLLFFESLFYGSDLFWSLWFPTLKIRSFLIFMISYLLLTLGFDCSYFSDSFSSRVSCWFEIFLLFQGRPVSVWTSL